MTFWYVLSIVYICISIDLCQSVSIPNLTWFFLCFSLFFFFAVWPNITLPKEWRTCQRIMNDKQDDLLPDAADDERS